MNRRTRMIGLTTVAVALTFGCAGNTLEAERPLFAELLALAPGSVVADIGAGNGAYAIALAPLVAPGGRMIATELEAEQREAILAAAAEAGVPVEVRPADLGGTGLPPESCDAIFLRDVYHHLTDPKSFVASLYETLRPGGRLVLVDFPPAWLLAFATPEGIPGDRGGHGISPDLMIEELEAAGFRTLETIDPWPSANFVTKTYAVAFERP